MSENKGRGEIAAGWWREALADRESSAARGLAARLRRSGDIAVLAEPAVQELARRLGSGPAEAGRLVRLVQILAELRADDGERLASRVGGVEPILSTLRFQRLLRARDEEFVTALRRAIVMADRRANVARLSSDILLWDHPDWGDRVRARWCFEFFDVSSQGTEPQSSAEVSS